MTRSTRLRIAAALHAAMAAQHVTVTRLSKTAGINPRTVKRIFDGEPAQDRSIGRVATALGWSVDQFTDLLCDAEQNAAEQAFTSEAVLRGYRNVLEFAEEARALGASNERIRIMTTAALDILEESNCRNP